MVQRTYTDLILCDDSTDSLLLEQAADESLRITLRHDPTVGNLNVTIRTDEAEDLGTSNNVYGVEVIEIEQSGGDRQLNIVIAGDAGFDVPYQLTVERLAADACLSDEYEGLLGNDDVDHATPAIPGSLTHNICADADWFSYDFSAGIDLTIAAFPSGRIDAVDAILYDSAVVEVAETVFNPDSGELSLNTTIESSGTYFVEVKRNDPTVASNVNRLDVAYELAANAATLTCQDSQLVTPAAAVVFSSGMDLVRVPLDCGTGTGRTEVAHFDLAGPETVVFALTGQMATVGVDVRSDCEDAQTSVQCTLLDEILNELTVRTGPLALPAGRHYVVFEFNANGDVPLDLEVQ